MEVFVKVGFNPPQLLYVPVFFPGSVAETLKTGGFNYTPGVYLSEREFGPQMEIDENIAITSLPASSYLHIRAPLPPRPKLDLTLPTLPSTIRLRHSSGMRDQTIIIVGLDIPLEKSLKVSPGEILLINNVKVAPTLTPRQAGIIDGSPFRTVSVQRKLNPFLFWKFGQKK